MGAPKPDPAMEAESRQEDQLLQQEEQTKQQQNLQIQTRRLQIMKRALGGATFQGASITNPSVTPGANANFSGIASNTPSLLNMPFIGNKTLGGS